MTNGEWLDYLAHNAPDELAAWFDAEHVETKERVLDGDTDALERKSADLIHEYYKPMVSELQAQVDAKDNCIENIMQTLHETQARASNLADDLLTANNERDNWKANCEDWKNHARAAENACYETMLEREAYRRKFGKCLDYADAIHALMDDEGLA